MSDSHYYCKEPGRTAMRYRRKVRRRLRRHFAWQRALHRSWGFRAEGSYTR